MTRRTLKKYNNVLTLDYNPKLESGAEVFLYKRPYFTIPDKTAREEAKQEGNEYCISIFVDNFEQEAVSCSKKDLLQIKDWINKNVK
jgi:hypothetical protein